MLTITDDLSAFTLAAGEPFILDLRFHDADGAAMPLAGRAFALSFHDHDRVAHAAINGEIVADGEGDRVRFARDGRLSESLYGWPLIVELAERYRHGRDVIARGTLTILPSAGEVVSLDGAAIAGQGWRVTIRAGTDGAAPVFARTRIPFDAPSAPMLAALSLAAGAWTVDVAVDLPVTGTTPNTLLAATLPPGLTIADGRIVGAPAVAGPAEITLVETLAGAGNSPRTTVIAIIVAAAPVAADAVLPPHPIGPVDLGTQTAIGLRMMVAEPYMVGARFRRATNTADFWFRMTDAENGVIFRIVDDDHYRLIRVAGGVQSSIGGYEYRTFSPPLVAAPDTAFVELRVAADGSVAFFQNGIRISAKVDAAFLDAIQPRGYGVRFAVTIGPAMANVTAGSLAPPLEIHGATIDPATRRIDLAIGYVGTPDAYDYAIGGGAWAAARTLSSAQAGQAVLRLPALAAGIAGDVSIALRQRNAPAASASITVSV
ncbi:hypothetical protein GCM10022268_12730 [Sphingomonas cynarae]|uniref:Uncharacterized protein n=1 Tax=Sphingomonas cynarae TaxID=930197 RepID=A0ABP7DHT8_9SPHN